ncbi:MAG: NIPSNAP family protein [Pseudomonadota bacterium]
MNFQLLVETFKPGQSQSGVKFLAAHDRQKNAGRWVTEFGTLDQVLSLYETPEGHPAPLFPTETSGYAQANPRNILRRDVLPLRAVKEYQPGSDKLFELREYSLLPGTAAEFAAHMLAAMPVRERHSANVGIWLPLSGDADRIFHMWSYRDLAHRAEVRAAVGKEAGWQAYLEAVMPLLRQMNSTLLTPAPSTAPAA